MPYKNKADRVAQVKRWKATHKDRISEWGRRYYAENKQAFRERDKKYRADGRAKLWHAKYRKKANARRQEYNRRWILANLERHKTRVSAYRKKHPEFIRNGHAARRARMHKAVIGDRKKILAYYRWVRDSPTIICYWCGKTVPHGKRVIDHRVPIAKGGAHCASNFVPSCRSCNCKKWKFTPDEFALRDR